MAAECYASGIGARASARKAAKWLRAADVLHGFSLEMHYQTLLESATPLHRQPSSWYAWDEVSEAEAEDKGAAGVAGVAGSRASQVGEDGEWGGGGPMARVPGGGTQVLDGREYTDAEIREIALRQGQFFRPGVGVRIPKGVVSQYTGGAGAGAYGLEEGYDAPEDEELDAAEYADYGDTRAERRERWWDELRSKQMSDLIMNYQAPPDLLRLDRKRLIDGPLLREMLFKFGNWDQLVEKRSLLKYEKVFTSSAAKAKAHRRYRDVGRLQGLEVQSSVALEKKTRELEAKYGVGHGLRGWFGEQVA